MKDYTLKPSASSNAARSDTSDVRRILALDLGIGSYGIAHQERSGEGENKQFTFPIVRSCTLPGDWAELKEERTRRRMWRTRLAHIEREGWLRQVFERCGLQDAVLRGRRVKQIEVEETGPGGVKVTKNAGRWMQTIRLITVWNVSFRRNRDRSRVMAHHRTNKDHAPFTAARRCAACCCSGSMHKRKRRVAHWSRGKSLRRCIPPFKNVVMMRWFLGPGRQR